MNIYITPPDSGRYRRYITEELVEKLKKLGTVRRNPTDRPMTREELRAVLKNTDILVTHWSSPQVDAELLAEAPDLKLIAHCAGTVAHIASEACYDRGISVISANPVMAAYVAEATLGFILSATHLTGQFERIIRRGEWDGDLDRMKTLFGATIGMIGFGAVGRNLLPLLIPFGVKVKIYDPYITEDALREWPFASAASFEEVMRCPIVSLHAAQTPETYHMINEEALALMPDGGILVNTARGSLIDTDALISELKKGRLYAVLDVYENEGSGQVDPRLFEYPENTLLQPHKAAGYAGEEMTAAIFDDIRRFCHGEKLLYEVSRKQYLLMTQE